MKRVLLCGFIVTCCTLAMRVVDQDPALSLALTLPAIGAFLLFVTLLIVDTLG